MTMVLATGALDVAIGKLAYAVAGRPWLVIVAVMALFSLLGTTMGWADETLGFYALLIPLMLALGYDRMAAAGTIIASATVGCDGVDREPVLDRRRERVRRRRASATASGCAGSAGSSSRRITIAYVVRYAERVQGPAGPLAGRLPARGRAEIEKEQSAADLTLTGRQKLVLAITAFTFALLVFSVIPWDSIIGFETTDPITHETVQNDYWWNLGWWFPELTALFLVAAVVVGLVAGFGEKDITGNIATRLRRLHRRRRRRRARPRRHGDPQQHADDRHDPELDGGRRQRHVRGRVHEHRVHRQHGIAFIIPSSSGHATLAMPLLAPLGDFADVSRPLVVTAWSWGAGIARFITPTSAVVMAGLALAGVRYDKWIRFMLPLMGLLAVASLVMLGIAAALE